MNAVPAFGSVIVIGHAWLMARVTILWALGDVQRVDPAFRNASRATSSLTLSLYDT
ncbi:MAG: hypothetical protein WBQ26_14965 [Gemmatimonadaceae bacterium]